MVEKLFISGTIGVSIYTDKSGREVWILHDNHESKSYCEPHNKSVWITDFMKKLDNKNGIY